MRIVGTVLLCLVCSCAAAEPGDMTRRNQLAEQLVDAFGLTSIYDDVAARCMKPAEVLENDLRAVAAKHPEQFEGILPDSIYWSEVRTIYADYMNVNCTVASGKQLRPLFVQAYAEEMTEQELSAAIAFYSTPVGKAIANRSRAVTLKVTSAANKAADVAVDQAGGRFKEAIRVLRAKAVTAQE